MPIQSKIKIQNAIAEQIDCISSSDALNLLIGDESLCWEIKKLPRADAKEMEKINQESLIWAETHSHAIAPRSKEWATILGEDENLSHLCKSSDQEIMEWIGDFDSSINGSCSQDHEWWSADEIASWDRKNPPLLADPEAFIAAMAALHQESM